MDPRAPAWALLLLGAALGLALRPASAAEKLCGRRFVRALVHVCGGPRWSPEHLQLAAGGDDGEMLWWLDKGQFQGPVAERDPMLEPTLQSLLLTSPRRRRQTTPSNPPLYCCLLGCTQQYLLTLCPH